jgi:hypothetical protein
MKSTDERTRILQLVKLAQEAQDPKHQKYILTRIEETKPNQDNSCKSDGCKGEVVQRVAGVNSDGYFYHIPSCIICRRKYFGATDVRTVGMIEFQKLMNTPYGL